MITHKFRLYPNKKICMKLVETMDVCRQSYNYFLGELGSKEVIDKSFLQATIPDLGICDDRFKNVYQKCLQMEALPTGQLLSMKNEINSSKLGVI